MSELALVTGAAGGIGLEISRRLRERGYRIIAVERDDTTAAAAAAALGSDTLAVAADLSDRAAVAHLAQRIENEWAHDLHIVICNAGIIIPGDVVETAAEKFDMQLDVMLGSVIHLTAAAARTFQAKNSGHILATVSAGGILAMPGSAAYSAAKAGLRAYLSALSTELRHTRVSVSGIYPSAVDTTMLYHEATHGGSLLNFVGKVSTIDKVADRYDDALRSKRLETYLPYSDSSILCRASLECFLVDPALHSRATGTDG